MTRARARARARRARITVLDDAAAGARGARRRARVTAYDRVTGTHVLAWMPEAREERGVHVDEMTYFPNQDRNWLEGLLKYDTACFLIVVALVVATLYGYDVDEAWQRNSLIFWAKSLYALTAFPYMVFLVPGINRILTHARPTGYDPDGRCVPMRVAKRKTDDPNAAPTPAPAPTPAEAAEDPAASRRPSACDAATRTSPPPSETPARALSRGPFIQGSKIRCLLAPLRASPPPRRYFQANSARPIIGEFAIQTGKLRMAGAGRPQRPLPLAIEITSSRDALLLAR